MRADPPEGFEIRFSSPFGDHIGPFYEGVGDPPGELRVGLFVRPENLNSLSMLHGGMYAALADYAMGRSAILAAGRRCVTSKLTVEYLDAAKEGDWLVAHTRLVRAGNALAFANCDMKVGDALKATASGVFRLLRIT